MSQLRNGQRVEVCVVENLTRTQIVQYAGASGDFNPLHTDEVFARNVAGNPTVMAHGMLTMGLAAKAVRALVNEREIVDITARFLKPVWPGDTLIAAVEVTDVDEQVATVTVYVRSQLGKLVLSGEALVAQGDP